MSDEDPHANAGQPVTLKYDILSTRGGVGTGSGEYLSVSLSHSLCLSPWLCLSPSLTRSLCLFSLFSLSFLSLFMFSIFTGQGGGGVGGGWRMRSRGKGRRPQL